MPIGPSALRKRAASALADLSQKIRNLRVVLGLDGFVDEIIAVVDKRDSLTQFARVPSIKRFSEKIANAAGKSSNIELVVTQVKLGGNGPNMANALVAFGLPLTYVGNLGYPQIHPVFADLSKRARVISIADPGHTDALEFDDGKVMLGKLQTLNDVTWENLLRGVALQELVRLVDEAALVGFLNWTMLPHMSHIWEKLLTEVCPKLSKLQSAVSAHRLMFCDLADPEKRTAESLRQAMTLLGKFNGYFRVILGLNEKESFEVAEALGIPTSNHCGTGLQTLAADIRAKIGASQVVIHPTKHAVAADENGTAYVDGPYTPSPRLSTGAGDNFNAGYCLGALLGLDKELCLLLGVATSGFYVRNARSPGVAELEEFLRNWPS